MTDVPGILVITFGFVLAVLIHLKVGVVFLFRHAAYFFCRDQLPLSAHQRRVVLVPLFSVELLDPGLERGCGCRACLRLCG